MFHKASAVAFQLRSIIKHNTQSSAHMHGHTLPGWRAQADTPNLIYYRSALPATDLLPCLLLFVIRSMRRCLGINGSRTPRKVTITDATGGQITFVCASLSICTISCLPLIPNYTHLLLTCSAVLLIKAVSVRSC